MSRHRARVVATRALPAHACTAPGVAPAADLRARISGGVIGAVLSDSCWSLESSCVPGRRTGAACAVAADDSGPD